MVQLVRVQERRVRLVPVGVSGQNGLVGGEHLRTVRPDPRVQKEGVQPAQVGRVVPVQCLEIDADRVEGQPAMEIGQPPAGIREGRIDGQSGQVVSLGHAPRIPLESVLSEQKRLHRRDVVTRQTRDHARGEADRAHQLEDAESRGVGGRDRWILGRSVNLRLVRRRARGVQDGDVDLELPVPAAKPTARRVRGAQACHPVRRRHVAALAVIQAEGRVVGSEPEPGDTVQVVGEDACHLAPRRRVRRILRLAWEDGQVQERGGTLAAEE